jgi:hypothetical protein
MRMKDEIKANVFLYTFKKLSNDDLLLLNDVHNTDIFIE